MKQYFLYSGDFFFHWYICDHRDCNIYCEFFNFITFLILQFVWHVILPFFFLSLCFGNRVDCLSQAKISRGTSRRWYDMLFFMMMMFFFYIVCGLNVIHISILTVMSLWLMAFGNILIFLFIFDSRFNIKYHHLNQSFELKYFYW